jgi:phospholipase D1/2
VTTPVSKQRSSRWLIFGTCVVLAGSAALLWRFTPLAEWAEPGRIVGWMQRIRESPWAPLIVIAAFVVGGLIVFPLTLLIAATAVVFEPWLAVLLAIAGALANAITLYAIGRGLMRDTMTHAFGEYVEKLRGTLDRSGIIAVATIRMVPVAPFTLVNLAAGAIDVRLRDYVLGTLLGVVPGTVALTAFGHQLRQIAEQPTLVNVSLLAAAIAVWVALSLGLQRLVSRRKSAATS